jgi:hypothetical protein
MVDRRGAFVRAISGVALALLVGTLFAGCSAGGGSHANAGANAVVPVPGAPGVKIHSASIPSGPAIRVMPDGSIIHIDLPPWERPNSGPHTAPVQYHGGSVIDQSVMYAIFWQPPGYYMSPKYKPTIERFFNDVGAGTRQYQILTQYSDSDGNPLNSSSLGGAWTDTAKFPAHMNDGTVRAEVLKAHRRVSADLRRLHREQSQSEFCAVRISQQLRQQQPTDRVLHRSLSARRRSDGLWDTDA